MSDGDLYTGITSASQRTLRQRANEEKLVKQSKLLPVAELIFNEIEKEKTKAKDVTDFITDLKTTPEELKADILARKRYIDTLTQLQNRFRVILKAKPEVK